MSGYVYPMTESKLMHAVLTYRLLSQRKAYIDDVFTQYNMIEANLHRQLEAKQFSQMEISKILEKRSEKIAIIGALEDIKKDLNTALRRIHMMDYDISDEDPLFRGVDREVSFRGFTGIPCPVCNTMRSFQNERCIVDESDQYIDAYEAWQVKDVVVHPKQRRCAIM